MASPLILKIQTLLDDKGFKQFSRGLEDARRGIVGLGSTIGALTGTVQVLGASLGIIFSADQIRRVTRLAAELQRSQAQLESFLAITLDDAGQAAQDFRELARQMSTTSRFAENDLVVALRNLTRSLGTASRATQALNVATEIAAANGISVAQASRAIGDANNGLIIALTRLTGLRREEIQQFRQEGRLLEELEERFAAIGAVGRDVETLNGALDVLRNRINKVRVELGEPLLEPLREFAVLLGRIPTEVLEFAGVAGILGGVGTSFKLLSLLAVPFAAGISAVSTAFLAFGFAMLKIRQLEKEVNADLRELNRTMTNTALVTENATSEFTKLFRTVEAEREAIADGLNSLRRQEELVQTALDARLRSLDEAEGREAELLQRQVDLSKQGLEIIENQKRALNERLVLLSAAEEAERQQGRLEARELGIEFEKLTLTQIAFQKRRLEDDIQNSITRLAVERDSAQEIINIAQRLTNGQRRLQNLLLQEEIQNIRQRVQANRELFEIFERTISPLGEDATDIERSRQRDRILSLQREGLRLSDEESQAQTDILNAEIARGEVQEDGAEERRRRDLIELRRRERELELLRQTKDELEEIGDIEGRRDVVSTLERRIATRERELRNRVAEVRREGFGALSPDEASAVEEVTRRIQRELELQRFRIEVNLGIDSATLERKLDAAIAGRLREAGFIVESSASASTEADVPPTSTIAASDPLADNPAAFIARVRGRPPRDI